MSEPYTTCDRCGTAVTVSEGQARRCGCGRTAIRWDTGTSPFAYRILPRFQNWRRS